jgi:hypothetical protein
MKKARIVVLSLLLTLFVLSTVASAAELWPGWFKHHDHGTTGGGGSTDGQTYSVAEPAAVLLLGAGLVSLGLYAKRKRGKQR